MIKDWKDILFEKTKNEPIMFPNNPNTNYTHKQSNRLFKVTGIETLESTKTYFKAHQSKQVNDEFYTFDESGYRTRSVLSIQYLDDKSFEYWLIDYDYTYIKTVEPKIEKDEAQQRKNY